MRKVLRSLSLLVSLLAVLSAHATPLSGTYTINNGAVASATNFRNIASAVAYLTGVGSRSDAGPSNSAPYGVSGPVVFLLSDGTYSELISIGAIAGSSATNTVTFKSLSDNAANVILASPTTVPNNSITWTLSGTQYVQFQKLKFIPGATSSNYKGAINLTNTCKSITFSGCVFSISNTSANQAIVSSGTEGFVFENGSIDAYREHIVSFSDKAVIIRNNTFTGNSVSDNVLTLSYTYSGSVQGNTFTNTAAAGIEINGGVVATDSLFITGNKFLHHNGNCIYLNSRIFDVAKPCVIKNNFFADITSTCINLYYTNNCLIVQNSFTKSTGSDAVNFIYFMEPGTQTVRNNIFVLKGAVNSGSSVYSVPYNYTLGINSNLYFSSDTAKYAAIRSRDPQARFDEPAFAGVNDLHIQNACLKIARLSYVDTDIDGESRGSVQVSYGADEVVALSNDARVLRVTAPVSVVVASGSAISFSAKVKNYGSSPLTSLQAAYSVNGGSPVVETFTGLSIASCDSGTISFSIPYTVTNEQTAVSVYPLQSNDVAETRNTADTATATYYTAMSGVYTINAAGSGVRNFKRFPEADSALISRGISGPVTFDIYPGSYLGDTLRSVAGISATNKVLIKSFTGDSTSVLLTRQMVVAQGAGFYTFKGLKFTGAPGSWDGPGSGQISILRNAHDVTVENCSFITPAYQVCGNGCSNERTYAVRSLNADSSIVIRNNKIWGTIFLQSAVETPSYNVNLPAIPTKNVVVTGNRLGSGRGYIFTSYTVYGINIDGAPAAVVDSNFVQNDLVFVKSSGAFRVTRNRIYDLANLTFQSYIGFIGNLYAYGNTIGLTVTGNGTAAARGVVANNMIHIKETGGNGLSVSGDYLDVVYNSINDRSDVAPNSSSLYNTTNASVAATVSGNNTVFKNNIISGIHTAGAAFKGQVISSTLAPADIDYNGYYTTEGTKNFATLTANNTSTFATWKASGSDAHSVFANPKFFTDTLLRPNQNVFNGAGTPVASVALDFENEERHATNPDLGADEFSLPTADAGIASFAGPNRIFAAGINPVKVTLRNYGTANLTSVTVNWKVNGVLQAPYSWSGVVNYDSASSPVTIGNFDFAGGRVYNFQFWTTAPNGAVDPIAANDTLYKTNVVAGLSGVYTIGGVSPDFSTFAQAINGLNLGGVTGPVTFNIRDGNYTELVMLKEVAGASTTNKIMFQSQNGDSSKVTITQASAYGSLQGTITVDGADNITLRKLTLQQTGSYGTGVVKLGNGAHNFTLENCLLRANLNNTDPSLFVDSIGIDSNIVIRNNRFLYGNYQIDINGNPLVNGPFQSGLVISGNRFDSAVGRAININGATAMELTSNVARYNGSSTPIAYLFTNLAGITKITNNQAYGRYQYGMQFSNSNTGVADSIHLYNNMIGLGTATGTAYGIYFSNIKSVGVYHNTVAVTGNGAPLSIGATTNTTVRNNIFQHYGTGNCYLLTDFTTPPSVVINNNNAFTNGTSVGRVFSTNMTWAQWQAGGRDVAGTNLRPVYVDSLSNLHLNGAYANLNNTGAAIGITADIDGDVRNAAAPDVGADEFKPYDNDAALLRFDSPVTPFAAGATPIKVTIRNFGQQPLTSATITYTVNGVAQPTFAYSGSISYGDSAVNLVIGTYTFVSARTDTVKAWISQPNGAADENNGNDTLVASFTPALCGTYTLGGASPDFYSMQEAATALSRGGVICPVVINVRNGEYTGAAQFAAIPGASAINTVTIQSESGDSSAAIISLPYDFSFNGYMIRLKGASFITFKKLSFLRRPISFYNQGFASSIFLMDSTSGKTITVVNCYLKSVGTSMTSASINNVGGSFRFENNYVDSMMTMNVTSRYASIANNHMKLGYITTTADSVYLLNNVLDSLSVVNVGGSSNLLARTFIKNNIFRNNTSSTTSLSINNTGGGEVSSNRMENSVGSGIYVSATNPTLTSPLIVSNNFVHVKGTSSPYGILLSGASNTYMIHNSVNMTGINTSSIAGYISGGTANTILNNNLANNGGGLAISLGNVSTVKDLNNNNYYTTGNNLGSYNSTNRINLAAWQTATGKDGASKSVSPGFVSTTDLHTLQTALDSAGTIAQYNQGSGYMQVVTTDIDGQSRNTVKPDIGADEISLNAVDAGVVVITEPAGTLQAASATKPVKVRIKNYGSVTVTAATVNWSVDGVAQTPYAFAGAINSQDTSVVLTIGTMNFAVGSSYTIKAWTVAVNSGTDGNNLNDTATLLNAYPALCGSYTVGGTAPDFSTLRSAINTLSNGGILCAVTLNIRNGVYTDSTFNIGFIPGRSATNTVTVRSESGDSSAVVLQTANFNNALLYNNDMMPVFVFNKAQYFTIQGMTLRFVNNPTAASPEGMVVLKNSGNKNISILNNVMESRTTNGRYASAGVTSAGNGSLDSNIVIRSNWLRRAGGIRLIGDADNSSVFSPQINMPGIVVENNRIDSSSNGLGISLKNTINPMVKGNNLPQSVIVVRYASSPQVIGNKVAIGNEFSPGYTVNTGIALSNITNTAIAHGVIANNFVSVADLDPANTNVPNGISTNGDYWDVMHNNILLRHTDANGNLFFGSGANVKVLNNIFVSPTGSTVLSGTTFGNCDYNDYYTTGNIAGTYKTLSDWTLATIYDDHSMSVEPFFTNLIDLHAHAGELRGAGVAAITTDIDGTIRSTPPSIGANEIAAVPNDAALTFLAAPVQPFTHGVQPVKVVLKNNGTATLSSATINWKMSDVAQPVYSWSGSLAPLATDTVTIGTYNFVLNSDNKFWAAVSLPNGSVDPFAGNDTLVNNNLWAALNGTYTIGGTAPTFIDFVQAFNQLQKGGVTGPVNIAVRNGVYSNNLYLNGIPGSGAGKPITIYGETRNRDSVSVIGYTTGFSHEYIAVLYNLSYLTFRNISFDNRTNQTTGSYGGVIKAGLNLHHLNFDSCLFKAIRPTGNTVNDQFNLVEFNYYAGATRNADSSSITNSFFIGGGKAIKINTISTDVSIKNITIKNNRFINQYFNSIESPYTIANSFIESNTIIDTTSFATYKAISLAGNQSNVMIRNNKIAVKGDGTAIDIANTTFSSSPITENRIVNNFVQIGNTGVSTGIKGYGKWLRIYHNTVSVTSTNASSAAGEFVPDGTTGGISIINNILANNGAGYSIKVPSNSFTSAITSNYNDLFTKGAKTGNWLGTEAAALSNWSSLSGKDVNSKAADPNFYNNLDLHTRQTALNNTGLIIIGVEATDIDGDARSSVTPDIGADEFSAPNTGVVTLLSPVNGCAITAAEVVKVSVKNLGSSSQSVVPVAYRINGGAIVRDTILTTLAAGDSVTVTFLGTADFSAIGSYDVSAWTDIPGDSIPSNDTLHTFIHHTKVVASYPYFENFETTNGGWFAQGKKSSWNWGVVASTNIDSAYSGTKAWKTNLSGQYNNNEKSYLESPCFNLTSFGSSSPKLWFMHAFQIEQANDSNWVEWSDNGGISWNRMGTSGGGEHWYNQSNNVWDGNQHDWELAGFTIPMNSITDKSAVRFRIAFTSNGSNVQDGIGIDNIFIDTLLPITQGNMVFAGRARSTGDGFVDIMSQSSERLVQINDSSNAMGLVTVKAAITAVPLVYNGVQYMGRHWVITPESQPTTPVKVRLYFTNAELDSLKAHDPSIHSVYDLAIYKYSGTNTDFDLGNNTGGADQFLGAPDVQFVSYANGYYAEFSVTGFSEFWITKTNVAPVVDMGVKGLKSPGLKTCYSSAEPVIVTIKNYSFNLQDFAANPVTITSSVAGVHAVNFAPIVINTGTLAPGDTINVTVAVAYDMTAIGAYIFNASTGTTSDVISANNAMAAVTHSVMGITAGTISSTSNSYCTTGGTPTLTLTGGAGYGSVQWQESATNSGPWTNVGAGTNSYTPSTAISATTYYRALLSCGVNSATTNTIEVTVNNPQVISVSPDSRCGFGVVNLTATASAGANVQWYSAATGGPVLFTGTNFSTPALTATTPYYVAAVINGCESARTPVLATITEAATIITQPTAQTTCVGSTVSFSVAATGANLSYQWRKGGNAIANATNATYTINAATAADTAVYSVVISGCNSVTSADAALTVAALPIIINEPTDQTACMNGAVTFNVSASGIGLSYQWRKNGSDISGATSATYTIAAVNTADAGNYDVRVTSGCGGLLSGTATLTVNTLPVIAQQPVNQAVCAGNNAGFNVVATGSDLTYQWRKDGSPITGANGASYTVSNVSSAQAGVYTVLITGSCGSVTSSVASLSLTATAVITAQPVNQTVCAGSAVTLSVSATGAAGYQWKKGGNVIIGATGNSYTIPVTAIADAGSYTVDVTGSCGVVNSNAAVLTVNTGGGCTTALPSIDADVTTSLLMPNVVHNHTTLRTVVRRAMKIEWQVSDASGKVVMQFVQALSAGTNNDRQIQTTQLAPGIYQIKGFTSNGKTVNLRFVKL